MACAQCRERVDGERMISLGVRAAGRAQLKHELADRLARRSAPDASGVWRWMAAAAVLIAAVGVWRLLTPVAPVPPDQDVPPSLAEEATKTPAVEAPPSEPITSPSPLSELSGRAGRVERREIALPSEETSAAAPAAGAGVTMAEAPPEAKMEDVAQAAEAKVAVEEESKVAAFDAAWIEATLLAPPVQNAQKMARAQTDGRAKDAKAELQTVGQGVSVSGPMPIQLRQALRSDLPVEQRRPTALASRETVPVRISLAGDSLLIVLFPPDPYSEDEMQKAFITRPRVDSVVVMVGRQLLGLRIPEIFLAR